MVLNFLKNILSENYPILFRYFKVNLNIFDFEFNVIENRLIVSFNKTNE